MEHLLFYDESSPTGLRWKVDIKSGRNYSISKVKAGDVAGSPCGRCGKGLYYAVSVGGKKYLCHRIIWELNYGAIPTDKVLDHKDGDGRNNRVSNLRIIDTKGNSQNLTKRLDNTTGVTGVGMKVVRGKMVYTAEWTDVEGHRKSKAFFESVHGARAFQMACQQREDALAALNSQGMQYTKRHGKDKNE